MGSHSLLLTIEAQDYYVRSLPGQPGGSQVVMHAGCVMSGLCMTS